MPIWPRSTTSAPESAAPLIAAGRDLGRREAHVAPDRHHLRLERGDVTAGDRVCALGVELVWHDSANVVGLEHGGRQHRGMSLVSVSIRPLQVRDADTLAALYTANREFLEPFDPPRPEGFATAAAQRRELRRARAGAGRRPARAVPDRGRRRAGRSHLGVADVARAVPERRARLLGGAAPERPRDRHGGRRPRVRVGVRQGRLPPARGGDARRQHGLADACCGETASPRSGSRRGTSSSTAPGATTSCSRAPPRTEPTTGAQAPSAAWLHRFRPGLTPHQSR